MHRHLRILEFAVASLLRHRIKTLMIVAVYVFVVFLLSSLILLSNALKNEARQLLSHTPELIVQAIRGGRHDLIPIDHGDAIRGIRGVRSTTPRFWGYYYDPPTQASFTLLGIDHQPPEIEALVEGRFGVNQRFPDTERGPMHACVIGQGVADIRFIGLEDIIPVRAADGSLLVLKVVGIFKADSSILTNDLVIVGTSTVRQILGIPPGRATDLVVHVRNPREVDTVSRKIQERFPTARIISRSQILSTYEALFGWRGGLAVTLQVGAIAAFAILAWNKAAGLSARERSEIGVLKAVGWDTANIIELKFWEGSAVSVFSFLTGAVAAHVHVYLADGALFAPVLRGWSVLFPQLNTVPHSDPFTLMIIMLLCVGPYVFATIVPAWKAAVTDPDIVLR